MDEHQLIEMLRPLAAPEADGFSNDAAAIAPPADHRFVITTDTLIEGVHFIGDEPAELIAKKALRVNLSDLAGMGAQPHRYSLALSLPKGTEADWCETFIAGLKEDQARYHISLLGGDTTFTPGPLTITITVIGLVPKEFTLTRCEAKAEDNIYVTGTLGDAAAGLKIAQGDLPHNASLLARYQLPEPRLEAICLLRNIASTAMDISDGLSIDLHRLCHASNAGAKIDASAIPTSHALDLALHGGDDYELLFTAPANCHDRIVEAAKTLPFSITRIGAIETKSQGIILHEDSAAKPLLSNGYTHSW